MMKKLLVLMLALSMILTLGISFVACDGGEEEDETPKDPEGTIVYVLKNAEDKLNGIALSDKAEDATLKLYPDGTVDFEMATAIAMKIKNGISSVMLGGTWAEADGKVTLTFENYRLTLEFVKDGNTLTYSEKVMSYDGTMVVLEKK